MTTATANDDVLQCSIFGHEDDGTGRCEACHAPMLVSLVIATSCTCGHLSRSPADAQPPRHAYDVAQWWHTAELLTRDRHACERWARHVVTVVAAPPVWEHMVGQAMVWLRGPGGEAPTHGIPHRRCECPDCEGTHGETCGCAGCVSERKQQGDGAAYFARLAEDRKQEQGGDKPRRKREDAHHDDERPRRERRRARA